METKETLISLSSALEYVMGAIETAQSSADGFNVLYSALRNKRISAYFDIRPYSSDFVRLPDGFWNDFGLSEFIGLFDTDDELDLIDANVHKNVLLNEIYDAIIGHDDPLPAMEVRGFADKFGQIDDNISIYVVESDINSLCASDFPCDSSRGASVRPGPAERDRGLPMFYAALYMMSYYNKHMELPPIKKIEGFLSLNRSKMTHTRQQAEITTIMSEYASMKRRFEEIIGSLDS